MGATSEILATFQIMDTRFRRACGHIRVLNRKIEELQVRYDRALKQQRRSFRYTYRLQLATLEGTRNMFYEYACAKADVLEKMQEKLVRRGIVSASTTPSDDDAEMEI